jgi:soluble lytic murein transglycosylase
MKLHSRLVLSTIFVLVFLCFTVIAVKRASVAQRDKIKKEQFVSKITSVVPTSGAQRDRIKKEEAISRITEYVRDENVQLEDRELRTISEVVYKESMRYNIDYRLVLALMKIESNFRFDAVSEKGARGLLQVKPSLARYIAEDVGITWQGDETLDEPKENIKIGVHVFSKLIEDFKSINMALHAYHVGPTRLRAILTEEKIPQKRYVNLVLDEYDRNISLLPAPSHD